jgi:hypothetical protein
VEANVKDTNDIGQGKSFTDPVKKYESQHGTYSDPIPNVPVPDRLPTSQFPEAPMSNPFQIGPIPGAK